MTVSIPQSTSYVVVFKAYLASDHLTEATGKTIAITISKNGGAFGNPNAGATNATAISSGWYKFTLDTTDTNTVGPIAYRGAEATIDDVGGWVNVTAEQADITAIKTKTDFLPSATAGAAGGVFIAGTNAATTVTGSFTTTLTGNLTGSVASVAGAVGSVTGNVGGNVVGSVGSVTGLTASNLDATVSSRLASASYTAPDNTGITAIKAKTDSLTFTKAGEVDANMQSINGTTITGNGTSPKFGV